MNPTRGDSLLTIGQVAERAGIRTSHIRYYERAGVLPQPDRVSGQRHHHEDIALAPPADDTELDIRQVRPCSRRG